MEVNLQDVVQEIKFFKERPRNRSAEEKGKLKVDIGTTLTCNRISCKNKRFQSIDELIWKTNVLKERGKRDYLEVTREVKYVLKVSKQFNLEGKEKIVPS